MPASTRATTSASDVLSHADANDDVVPIAVQIDEFLDRFMRLKRGLNLCSIAAEDHVHRAADVKATGELRLGTLSDKASLVEHEDAVCSLRDLGRREKLTRTVLSSARPRITLRISTICTGSSPLMGSSRMTSLGAWMIAWAMPTRLR